jgi:hypothetical protein
MNSNDLQNISKIYQEQVSTQLDELSADLVLRASKEASKRAAVLSALGADVPKAVKKAKKFRRQAERFYDYQAKKRREDSVSEGKKAKPDYLDFDDDGDEQEPMKKALRDRNKKSVKEALIGRQSEIDTNKNNKIDAQDFKILRSSKKKKIKEGFSNWREDLIEVTSKLEGKDGKEPKVVEKEVNNTVKINPNLDLGEAIEELGGTLFEMNEIEDFEGVLDDLSESEIFLLSDQLIEEVVEEFFYECIEEGYDILEVENQLLESLEISSSLLNEAEVTLGHDTKIKSDRLSKVKSAVKKVGKAVVRGAGYAAGAAVRGAKAVGREFKAGYSRGRYGSDGGSSSGSSSTTSSQSAGTSKPGLLGRIGSALKSGLKRVVAKGARKVARGAIGVARRMEKEKPSPVHSKSGTRTPSPRSGLGGGTSVERAGSPKPKTEPKKAEKPKDPWEGPATTPPQKPASKPQATTTTIPAPTSKKQRKKLYQDVLADVSGVSDAERRASAAKRKKEQDVNEDYYDLATKSVKPGNPGEDQKRTIEKLAKTATTKKKKRTPVGTARRGGGSFKPSSPEEAKADKKSWGDYWSTAAKGYKEQYEILEKAESEQQQKIFGLALSVKRGQTPRSEVSDRVLKIVDGMSEKEIRKFAKTKHEGLPHKVETKEEALRQELVSRMIEKIEQQSELYIDEAKLPKSEKMGKKQRQSKTLKLTDCDDCTHDQRHPDAAKIHVVNPQGEKTHSLTPGEFAKHQLPSGHKYGFDEFRKTKIVKDTTKPNKRVVGYLNREDYSVLDERIRRYPEQRGVTARGSMDDNRGFTQDMKSRIGVKNLKAVHFVGDIKKGSGPEKKATVAKQIVSKRPDAKEVHFIDDHPGNVKAVTDTLAKPGKTVKGKVGRTRETGPKVKGFVARPATKSKGTVKVGEVVPVRLGGEGREGNRGIRSGTSPSKSTKETQRRRKQQKMGEAIEIQPKTQENPGQQEKKVQQQQDRMKQQEVQILQRKLQTLKSAPKGTDPSITT